MSIEKVEAPRLPPSAAIRQEIAKQRTSMMVKASGMAPVLEMIDAWVQSVETRLALLEGMGGAVADFANQLRKEG